MKDKEETFTYCKTCDKRNTLPDEYEGDLECRKCGWMLGLTPEDFLPSYKIPSQKIICPHCEDDTTEWDTGEGYTDCNSEELYCVKCKKWFLVSVFVTVKFTTDFIEEEEE